MAPNTKLCFLILGLINCVFSSHISNAIDKDEGAPAVQGGDNNSVQPASLKARLQSQTNQKGDDVDTTEFAPELKSFVFWPNATVAFYIDPEHFDHEQALQIMTSLYQFSFKTCLKFAPVMARPEEADHVMVFENPAGIRKCYVSSEPHSVEEPHKIILGYDCLKSPDLDMMVMKALGFAFEHNRAIRDLYVEVQYENIEPGYMELYTKDLKLPMELRALPYDPNSVMHFGERDFSKNGHRTLMFKKRDIVQQRNGLSPLDLRKIDIVYGPECLARDRNEKVELCQNYPGVARRKRDITAIPRSLRVNPNITPPAEVENATAENPDVPDQGYADAIVKELGIDKEVEDLMDQVYKISAVALEKARVKYCNGTKASLREGTPKKKNMLGIVEDTVTYAKSLVDIALKNLTEFCEKAKLVEDYQRASCPFFNPVKCRQSYKSTKSGPVLYRTQHRPLIRQSTKHSGVSAKHIYHHSMRSDNKTEESGVDNPVPSELPAVPEVTAAVSKSDLRMGTRLVVDKKSVFMPSYRSTNDTAERRKREANPDSQAKENSPGNISVRSFQSQRYRASKKITDSKRWDKHERDWDNSGVSLEEPRQVRSKRIRSKKKDKIKEDVAVSEDMKDVDKEEKEERKKEDKEERTAKKDRTIKKDQVHKKDRVIKKTKPHKENLEDEEHTSKKEKKPTTERNDQQLTMDKPEDDYEKRSQTQLKPGPVPRTVKLSKKNKEFYEERIWQDGVVRYFIQEDGTFDIEDLRKRLKEVNEILKEKTCVCIAEIKEEETESYEDYLVLDSSPDYITGKVGGRQIYGMVELLKGGQHRQHTAMMVMAMLGFYFEVSRHDRDKYIRVHMRHVRPDKLHHFEKIREDATFPLPYDYNSATHPAWQFWRQIGKSGISTVATFKEQDPDGSIMKSLGQNEELLSELDLVKINSVYGTKCYVGGEDEEREEGKEEEEVKEEEKEKEEVELELEERDEEKEKEKEKEKEVSVEAEDNK